MLTQCGYNVDTTWFPGEHHMIFVLFPREEKWPHHFPFSQISLQSHVTTLNQPIRSLDSLKSPSSRWNLWDFVRFHSKFSPHLKSKAVRTALLHFFKNGTLSFCPFWTQEQKLGQQPLTPPTLIWDFEKIVSFELWNKVRSTTLPPSS